MQPESARPADPVPVLDALLARMDRGSQTEQSIASITLQRKMETMGGEALARAVRHLSDRMEKHTVQTRYEIITALSRASDRLDQATALDVMERLLPPPYNDHEELTAACTGRMAARLDGTALWRMADRLIGFLEDPDFLENPYAPKSYTPHDDKYTKAMLDEKRLKPARIFWAAHASVLGRMVERLETEELSRATGRLRSVLQDEESPSGVIAAVVLERAAGCLDQTALIDLVGRMHSLLYIPGYPLPGAVLGNMLRRLEGEAFSQAVARYAVLPGDERGWLHALKSLSVLGQVADRMEQTTILQVIEHAVDYGRTWLMNDVADAYGMLLSSLAGESFARGLDLVFGPEEYAAEGMHRIVEIMAQAGVRMDETQFFMVLQRLRRSLPWFARSSTRDALCKLGSHFTGEEISRIANRLLDLADNVDRDALLLRASVLHRWAERLDAATLPRVKEHIAALPRQLLDEIIAMQGVRRGEGGLAWPSEKIEEPF